MLPTQEERTAGLKAGLTFRMRNKPTRVTFAKFYESILRKIASPKEVAEPLSI